MCWVLEAADQASVAVPARSENSESGRRIAIEVAIEIRASDFMGRGTIEETVTGGQGVGAGCRHSRLRRTWTSIPASGRSGQNG
jgi:hypothetical protein